MPKNEYAKIGSSVDTDVNLIWIYRSDLQVLICCEYWLVLFHLCQKKLHYLVWQIFKRRKQLLDFHFRTDAVVSNWFTHLHIVCYSGSGVFIFHARNAFGFKWLNHIHIQISGLLRCLYKNITGFLRKQKLAISICSKLKFKSNAYIHNKSVSILNNSKTIKHFFFVYSFLDLYVFLWW